MDTILHEIQHAVQARSGIESIHTDFLLDYKQTMVAKTAGTLSKAAGMLKEKGALSVRAFCTHPVLSGKAYENIENSELEELRKMLKAAGVAEGVPPGPEVEPEPEPV